MQEFKCHQQRWQRGDGWGGAAGPSPRVRGPGSCCLSLCHGDGCRAAGKGERSPVPGRMERPFLGSAGRGISHSMFGKRLIYLKCRKNVRCTLLFSNQISKGKCFTARLKILPSPGQHGARGAPAADTSKDHPLPRQHLMYRVERRGINPSFAKQLALLNADIKKRVRREMKRALRSPKGN